MFRGLSRVGKKALKFSLTVDLLELEVPSGAQDRRVLLSVARHSRNFSSSEHSLLASGRPWHDPITFNITLYRDKKGDYQGKSYKVGGTALAACASSARRHQRNIS
mmetsp:Transcript_3385/g.9880  ORF Transcript_3385/g.9880 Transcript_3385/m.9880 type:complete len:106 (-) Transcript_3385:2588-2905(-)